MKIAFTLCSNNYLAQAKTLGDSLARHNPDYRFVIGLVDKKSDDVDYALFFPHQVIAVEEIGIERFDDLCKRYDIIELNTAVKPFFFSFIFREYPGVESVIYLDPDIMVFGDFTSIENELSKSSVVITPHILSPIEDDNCRPQEKLFLRFGIYNLGFIAIANRSESFRFLKWWGERTYRECYSDFRTGVFVDQLWMNLAPVFFKGVTVSLNPGLSVAYWNLHERKLSAKDGLLVVNDNYPLVFYHFSAYDPQNPSVISANQTRCSFATRPDLIDLFDTYREALFSNGYLHYKSLTCHYVAEGNRYRAMEVERRCAESQDWLQAGFLATHRGDLISARHYFSAAVRRNPLVLRNLGILSILIESFVGSDRMARYRQWRRDNT